ncbi:hypothetical protein FSP39_006204 [Pinctada imbricata]|uniref:Uncharacterized protein n=1 Tax=Pinctada imbricata TaxID=66713 RepID=A0AA89BY51_PINIB|nr:hypothetical protein FSP39_006204 [Pinctada imbricata]
MSCRGIGLTSIPDFDAGLRLFTRVDLSNNSITSIGANSFQNLQSLVELDLSNNYIATVDAHAFDLVRNITSLNLRGNQMTILPNLIQMKKLQILDVSDNPIRDTAFDSNIMRSLGSTLREFHFGHKTVLTNWPRTTDHLQRLETLDLNGGMIYFIPPNSFSGFESRLKSLTIQYTKLTATPLLSSLKFLEELHLDHNQFGDYGVLEATFSSLSLLKVLSLNDDALTEFPAILKHLPSLTSLSLNGNHFYYISDNAVNILSGTTIQHLSLEDCNLDRIPGSIAGVNLNSLIELDLAHNNIISIERSDLDGLRNLQNVSFAYNPLRYVSTQSLKNLSSLTFLDLGHTDLVTVPIALKNIQNLQTVTFMGDHIECNCNLIEFQKLQRSKAFDVEGMCETIEVSIVDYLNKFIPNCPDYV